MADQPAYGFVSQWMHRLALGWPMVAQASLDMELTMQRVRFDAAAHQPVFVSGLARSGTTVLMRSLYNTGVFRSLTYRDMPFVMMPGLWSRMSQGSRKAGELKQRAHADQVMVSFDSPEAFDEVFWRAFCRGDYIHADRLTPHQPDDEAIEKFQQYIGAIIASAEDASQTRYLSKNNNNIIRLPALFQAFPNAAVIVPFRDPVQHAMSLKKQHDRFLQVHQEDRFALTYMNLLAHHEFGANLKSFVFEPTDAPPPTAQTMQTEEDWVRYWTRVYGYLGRHAPTSCIFLSYERLCADPHAVLGALAERLSLDGGKLCEASEIRQPAQRHEAQVSAQVLAQADQVYHALAARSV